MPLFTAETARAAQLASAKAKLAKRARALTVVQDAARLLDESATSSSQRQRKELELDLDWVTEQIRLARALDQGPKVMRLLSVKAKIWQLLYPKPGSLKPKPERQRQAAVELPSEDMTHAMNHDEAQADNVQS
jgi:hypothetical protein